MVPILALLAGCGSGGHATQSTRASAPGVRAKRNAPAPAAIKLSYRRLYSLPAPLRDPAFATLGGGRFALLGGLDAADVSSSGVLVADGRRVLSTASLPGPQHDAQGALINGSVYVFGGGDVSELDHILRFDPRTGSVSAAGSLPHPASDVAVAANGDTAYVVGGYDGTTAFNTILSWRPGSTARVVGRLPLELRYAAVTVADGGLLVIGGSTPTAASNAIFRFDLTTHKVRQIGTLPKPTTHGSAATLGSSAYLLGGRGDLLQSQTDRVWAINPVTGRVRPAGRLPSPISDAAAFEIGGAITVVGGQTPTSTLDQVGELVPVPAR
ncbi:MAG: kelch repeat-containing protein [Solirubrobacteraceae bacterium]